MIVRALAATLLAIALLAGEVIAEEGPPISLSGAYYWDSRDFSTASIGIASDRLPLGFSLWGFTDVHGDHNSGSLELTRAFSEYRLSHSWPGNLMNVTGLAFQLESNVVSGAGNDLLRAGMTFKHALRLPWLSSSASQGWLQWRAFPYETDENGGQASVIYNMPLNSRLFFKGFADYNFIDGARNRWVVESEVSWLFSERFSALLEHRFNQYEAANPALDGSAVAIGLRYQFAQ